MSLLAPPEIVSRPVTGSAAPPRQTTENVLVLGATSGIAKPLCQLLAARGCRLVLAGRNLVELDRQATDLQIRHQAEVSTEAFDALDFDDHAAFFERCREQLGGTIDGVVLCYGYMVPQSVCDSDFHAAKRTIDVNFTSPVSILNVAATYLSRRGTGWIAAISSVAGDRGRQSNHTYGATKAALSTYLQGLRNRLYHEGVHVLTIKPGFVDTPMTRGLLNPRSPLVATPERVARDIDRAIRWRTNVLYTPWFWRGILAILGSIPEFIFKRLKT